jgi:hypothetical protein
LFTQRAICGHRFVSSCLDIPGREWDCYVLSTNSSRSHHFVASCDQLSEQDHLSCFTFLQPSLSVFAEAAGLAVASAQLIWPMLLHLGTMYDSKHFKIGLSFACAILFGLSSEARGSFMDPMLYMVHGTQAPTFGTESTVTPLTSAWCISSTSSRRCMASSKLGLTKYLMLASFPDVALFQVACFYLGLSPWYKFAVSPWTSPFVRLRDVDAGR